MAFMEQFARNRLAEAEAILLSKFEHAANCLLPARRLGNSHFPGRRQRLLFDDRLKILLQVYASSLRLREKARFDFWAECEGYGQRILLFAHTSLRQRRPIAGRAELVT